MLPCYRKKCIYFKKNLNRYLQALWYLSSEKRTDGSCDSSIHGMFQARILEWVVISFSRESSWPRAWTRVSRMADRFFTTEPPGKLTYITAKSFNKINLDHEHLSCQRTMPNLTFTLWSTFNNSMYPRKISLRVLTEWDSPIKSCCHRNRI